MYITAEGYAEEAKKLESLQDKLHRIRQKKNKLAEEYGENWHFFPSFMHILDDEKEIKKRLEQQYERFSLLEVREVVSVSRVLEDERPEVKDKSKPMVRQGNDKGTVVAPRTGAAKVTGNQVYFEKDIPTSIRPRVTIEDIYAMHPEYAPKDFVMTVANPIKSLIEEKTQEASFMLYQFNNFTSKIMNIVTLPFRTPQLVLKGKKNFAARRQRQNNVQHIRS